MNRFLTAVLLLAGTQSIHAQYYYNDIIGAGQTNAQYLSFKNNHVKEISASSFESDNKPADGFELTQTLTADYKKISTAATYPSAGTSITTHYYNGSQLVRTEDSTARVATRSIYTYNVQQQIAQLSTTTSDAFMNSSLEEAHIWSYQSNGTPSGMLKIKDGQDTTFVSFIYDEAGNISEERWTRKGVLLETWYYYYNDKKQLSDIVRFNDRAKRLLPDYLFEYDETGRVAQMTQIRGNSNYIIWKYVYNAQGLKVRDLAYNKQKQMVGRIEYSYTYQK